jgi:8-oxo-dGTP diphosphatase
MQKTDSPQALGCCVALINDQGRVLLGLRKNSYKADWWGIPGGRLEVNETLADCARREVLEEVGLTALKLDLVAAVVEPQDGYHFVHFGFVCREWDGVMSIMEPDKCQILEWFDPAELPGNILPGHKAVIDAAVSGIWQQIVEL